MCGYRQNYFKLGPAALKHEKKNTSSCVGASAILFVQNLLRKTEVRSMRCISR